MVINLADAVSMAQALQAFFVCIENLLIGERKVFFEPAKESGAEIEADMRIVIVDGQDLPLTINNPGMGMPSISSTMSPTDI